MAPGGEDTTKHAQAKGRGLTIVTEQWVVDRANGGGGGGEDDGGDGHQFDEAEDEDQNIVTSAAKFRDKLRGVEELSRFVYLPQHMQEAYVHVMPTV